jgi:hypothetical protein
MTLTLIALASRAAEPEHVWVAKSFAGGKQCDPLSHYNPPDVSQLLGRSGITVNEVRIEALGVCLACDCPQYAAIHYARIQKHANRLPVRYKTSIQKRGNEAVTRNTAVTSRNTREPG